MTCCESIDEWLEFGLVPRQELLSAIKLKMLITAPVTTMGLTLAISRHDDWLLPLVRAAIDSRLASYLSWASAGGGLSSRWQQNHDCSFLAGNEF